jgi:hypothetical protein
MDAIDKILSTEEELAPASGFVAAVMDRVREEAAAPPPIPFPWKRFLPGMIVACVVLGAAAFLLVRYVIINIGNSADFALPEVHISAVVAPHLAQAGWIALAAALSVGSWLFSRRLSGRGGLL